MINKNYQKQVNLLLKVLPEVAKETCFALHGGTAINLFIREIPRLSVDIDLTYLPIEDREKSVQNINRALDRIKKRIETVLFEVHVKHRKDLSKLLIALQDIEIKLEVNLIARGTLEKPKRLVLCEKAQNEYDAFVAIQVVSVGQLYGGKICAALDRQHPRDLFDVKYLLESDGLSEAVKQGFLLCLVGSKRSIHEILSPNLLDQRAAMQNQFEGMSSIQFTYDEFEDTRNRLISMVNQSLTLEDKKFLLSIKGLKPNWSLYNFSYFPAVKWKLKNLLNLKNQNFQKYMSHFEILESHLFLHEKIHILA